MSSSLVNLEKYIRGEHILSESMKIHEKYTLGELYYEKKVPCRAAQTRNPT